MCAGLRDAINLAFKIHLATQGIDVLDSYQQERLPHAAAVIGLAMELGKVICVADPHEADARDNMLIPLVPEDGASEVPGMPPLADGLFDSSPGAGELFPQSDITCETRRGRADDVVPAEWRLWHAEAEVFDDQDLEWFRAHGGRVLQMGDDIHDLSDSYATWLSTRNVNSALERPDFHVFGTRPAGSAGELLAALRGALS
jgi:hypothetical protein